MCSLIPYPNRHRHAVTLVELLVALAVISVLASIALPTVKNTLRGQRISRGASLLQSAIQEGRARAIARGGGGVIIDRVGGETLLERSQAIRVRMADAPLPYTGDAPNSTARYQFVPDGTVIGFGTAAITNPNGPRGVSPPPAMANPGNPFWDYHVLLFNGSLQPQILRSARDIASGDEPTLINRQDQIRIGSAGFPMTIESIVELDGTTAPPLTAWNNATPGELPGYPNEYVMVELVPQEPNTDLRRFAGSNLGFSISKSPRPAIAMPIELPKGTAIDLTASGIGRFGNEFSPMWVEGNYTDETIAPFPAGTRDYGSIYVLFGARGEVSRIATVTSFFLDTSVTPPKWVPILSSIPVTGDVHFLVGEAGETKTAPSDQLEDNDPDPLGDEAKDGKTPLLNGESIWVTIKSRNGEVVTSRWIDPTDPADPATKLIADPDMTITDPDARRQDRIQKVIARTRTGAVDARGGGL